MAFSLPPARQLSACVKCIRYVFGVNCQPSHSFSMSAIHAEEQPTVSSTAPLLAPSATPSPPMETSKAASESNGKQRLPEYMQRWGILDPHMVENKKQERRLIRRDHIQPLGSRRRRAALRRFAVQKLIALPFEQLPYQCFQEARKILLEDRQEKLREIEVQRLRIKNLIGQDSALSGDASAKSVRVKSMKDHLNYLIVQADINDPMVKRKFEDGLEDMNKPVYRHLAEQKWRTYKRLLLEQRVNQMNIIPDFLPKLDIIADINFGFGKLSIEHGAFVDSAVSEKPPRLSVQVFSPGERLVTVVIVDGDVPVLETDGFSTRCHFIASNISISPSQSSIPLQQIVHEDRKSEDPALRKICLSWMAPWAHRGAPYHRMVIFVLDQDGKLLDVSKISLTKRSSFNVRSFIDTHKLHPITATLFRTKWDESMAGVMERNGLSDQVTLEFKRKRIEPLPPKRRTERMR